MEKVKEIWKAIEGYQGAYEVSNQGRVRNIKRGGKVLSSVEVSHGYTAVKLYKKGKSRTYLLHRLVASAFIPNPENKSQVNHIDMIKSHNSVDNLEWVTAAENIFHAFINKPPETRKKPWEGRTSAHLWRSRLQKIREEKGMTPKELADASCVRLDTIAGLEKGDKCFKVINVNTLCKLAYALNVGINELFEYDVAESIRREKEWHKSATKCCKKPQGREQNGNQGDRPESSIKL